MNKRVLILCACLLRVVSMYAQTSSDYLVLVNKDTLFGDVQFTGDGDEQILKFREGGNERWDSYAPETVIAFHYAGFEYYSREIRLPEKGLTYGFLKKLTGGKILLYAHGEVAPAFFMESATLPLFLLQQKDINYQQQLKYFLTDCDLESSIIKTEYTEKSLLSLVEKYNNCSPSEYTRGGDDIWIIQPRLGTVVPFHIVPKAEGNFFNIMDAQLRPPAPDMYFAVQVQYPVRKLSMTKIRFATEFALQRIGFSGNGSNIVSGWETYHEFRVTNWMVVAAPKIYLQLPIDGARLSIGMGATMGFNAINTSYEVVRTYLVDGSQVIPADRDFIELPVKSVFMPTIEFSGYFGPFAAGLKVDYNYMGYAGEEYKTMQVLMATAFVGYQFRIDR